MFERYTEKARRVIFFSRYEASQIGGRAIEPEHLLLGLLREDLELFGLLFPEGSDLAAEATAIRNEIEASQPREEKLSSSVDMPLSKSTKQALSYASDESQKLGHHHIGTEHLLLGLLRDESSLASRLLLARGLKLEEVETKVSGGSITHQHKQAETPAGSFSTQLTALVELLIRKGLFTREEFVAELVNHHRLFDLQAPFQTLLGLLSRKGVINEDDTREILGLSQ